MEKGLFKCFLFSALIFFFSNQAQAEPIVSGRYTSLDGKFEHVFMTSGDYEGMYTGKTFPEQVSGVFKQGRNACHNNYGAAGNIMIFYGELQCCLSFNKISDKFAVTKVGFTYDFPAGICQNQVLIKKDK